MQSQNSFEKRMHGMLKIETRLLHSRFIEEIKAREEVIYSLWHFCCNLERSTIGNFTGRNVEDSYFCNGCCSRGGFYFYPMAVLPRPAPTPQLLLPCCARLRLIILCVSVLLLLVDMAPRCHLTDIHSNIVC